MARRPCADVAIQLNIKYLKRCHKKSDYMLAWIPTAASAALRMTERGCNSAAIWMTVCELNCIKHSLYAVMARRPYAVAIQLNIKYLKRCHKKSDYMLAWIPTAASAALGMTERDAIARQSG